MSIDSLLDSNKKSSDLKPSLGYSANTSLWSWVPTKDELAQYSDAVVFADLNMKISLLWVSVKPIKGMLAEIPSAIIASVPEAKLVSERPPTL